MNLIIAALAFFLIPQTPAPTQATMRVSPTEQLSSSGPAGGPFDPSMHVYQVNNIGNTAMAWSASVDVDWLTLSSASGTIPPRSGIVVTATIDSDADVLAAGGYIGRITYTNVTHPSRGSTFRDISLSVGGVAVTPGGGWGGPTAEPGQIGTGTAKAIARWDVVAYQDVVEEDTSTFEVGVVAFHIAGIEKVTMAVEGGSFVDITEMSLNPRTGVWEYVGVLTLSDFTVDGQIELRAIAYPNAAAPQAAGTDSYPGGGYPRLLKSLFLYVDVDTKQAENAVYCSADTGDDTTGDGTEILPVKTMWKAAQIADTNGGGDAGGAIVYCDMGNYTFLAGSGAIPDTAERYITFRPKIGVTRDQVHINSASYPGMRINKQRVFDLTVNTFLHGDDGCGGGCGDDTLWADDCDFIGAGPGTAVHFGGWTPGWVDKYWTDCTVKDNQGSAPSGVALMRNCTATEISYGLAYPELVVNCAWDNMAEFGSGAHGAILNWNSCGGCDYDNAIIYNTTWTNIDAESIRLTAVGDVDNTAIVNMAVDLIGLAGGNVGDAVNTGVDHFLVYNTTHIGPPWRFGMPEALMTNMSFRGNHFNSMGIQSGGCCTGDTVKDEWFDHNNFASGAGITPGTNTTTLDPQLSLFTPSPTSPLLNRLNPLLVPIDLNNAMRTVPGTVGAVE